MKNSTKQAVSQQVTPANVSPAQTNEEQSAKQKKVAQVLQMAETSYFGDKETFLQRCNYAVKVLKCNADKALRFSNTYSKNEIKPLSKNESAKLLEAIETPEHVAILEELQVVFDSDLQSFIDTHEILSEKKLKVGDMCNFISAREVGNKVTFVGASVTPMAVVTHPPYNGKPSKLLCLQPCNVINGEILDRSYAQTFTRENYERFFKIEPITK